jgi:superfamily II DNA or RNA helicase
MGQTHLRPYQIGMVKKIMDEFETKQSVMCQMPTGTGKTEVFCEIIKQYLEKNRNKKVLVLVHRLELLRQIKSRLLKRVNIEAGASFDHTEYFSPDTFLSTKLFNIESKGIKKIRLNTLST